MKSQTSFVSNYGKGKYAVVLLVSMALSACSSDNSGIGAGVKAPPSSISALCSTMPPTDRVDFGNWYDLYKMSCGPSATSTPSESRVVTPDAGGGPANPSTNATVKTVVDLRAVGLGATALTTLYVYGTDEGTPIPANPDRRYIGYDFTGAEFQTMKPLVVEILTQYGNPETNLGKLRALRDWVARTAIHPYTPFHANVNKNLEVLPLGSTWLNVDALSNGYVRWTQDTQFWD